MTRGSKAKLLKSTGHASSLPHSWGQGRRGLSLAQWFLGFLSNDGERGSSAEAICPLVEGKPFTAESAALMGVFHAGAKTCILIALLWNKLLSKAS